MAEELRAGHLCLELGVVWATAAGFWSQHSFGAGEVRTSNWAFAFQFKFLLYVKGLREEMKWKF